ncbi:uncharacterized protein LOC143588184 [Bidens hawaiensis]|uniref:uncharacterized protein LOC143588184 n=1 Tax=Bidens hawaiensis TaxID=980011 RepID=UPI00404B486D
MKSEVVKLHRHIREGNVHEIGKMYESTVLSLPWEDVVEYLDKDDYVFSLLYREMWYRQLSSPTLKHRIASWSNYGNLFEFLFPSVLCIRLPYQWLWDMVDEFVNQFQSFCVYRALENKNEQDTALLRKYYRAWNVYDAVNLLQRLMEKSKILEQSKDGVLQLLTATEDGISNALKVIGYFSMVGLLRVHCLLGSYEVGLDCLRPIDISQQGFYTSLIATHITTIFHYGFANIMLGRYVDTIREFNNILVYIFKQPQQESPQILNKIEHMYALLAIFLLLCPHELQLINENVHSQQMEKYGDKMQRCDDIYLYRELLSYAWPAFTTPFAPNAGDPREFINPDLYEEDELVIAYPVFFISIASGDFKPLVNHNQRLLIC